MYIYIKSPNHPSQIFNETAVRNVNEQNHLDFVLDLSFEKHLTERIINVKKNIGLTKQFFTSQAT